MMQKSSKILELQSFLKNE